MSRTNTVLVAGRKAILGALKLYLDFINMFLFLLRFLGVLAALDFQPPKAKGPDGDIGAFVMTGSHGDHPRPNWFRIRRNGRSWHGNETARLCRSVGRRAHHSCIQIGSTSIPGILAKLRSSIFIPVAVSLEGARRCPAETRSARLSLVRRVRTSGRRYCWRKAIPQRASARSSSTATPKAFPRSTGIWRSRIICARIRRSRRTTKPRRSAPAALHPDNTLDYNAAKDGWIKRTEADALVWRRMQKAAHAILSPAAFRGRFASAKDAKAAPSRRRSRAHSARRCSQGDGAVGGELTPSLAPPFSCENFFALPRDANARRLRVLAEPWRPWR